MKIDLPIQKYSGWQLVKAEIVSIGEWLPGSFAVHPNPYTWEFDRWIVTNIETGGWCGRGASRRIAVENARARALKISKRRFQWLVRCQCKKYPQILDTSVLA